MRAAMDDRMIRTQNSAECSHPALTSGAARRNGTSFYA
jgi:hypothetical protein